MNAQSASENSFSMEQIQKQLVLLKPPEMYLSINITYVDVIDKGSTWKINSEMLRTAGIQCIHVVMAQWTVESDLLMHPKTKS